MSNQPDIEAIHDVFDRGYREIYALCDYADTLREQIVALRETLVGVRAYMSRIPSPDIGILDGIEDVLNRTAEHAEQTSRTRSCGCCRECGSS